MPFDARVDACDLIKLLFRPGRPWRRPPQPDAVRITMKLWLKEDHPAIAEMRQRLDEFYGSTTTYNAFNAVSDQQKCWETVLGEIASRLERSEATRGSPIRVLEFGAGRTGFGRFLGEPHRAKVTFVAQDIVDANAGFLREEADEVFIGDLSQVSGHFDVVFSTYVWEHVSNPVATLETLLRLVSPGGVLLLFSPRYDAPLYVPPALRHLPKWRRWTASVRLWLDRLRVGAGGAPGFWITPRPAVLDVEHWYRDADAVHLVSIHDIQRALAGRARVTKLVAGTRWQERLLQLRVRIEPFVDSAL